MTDLPQSTATSKSLPSQLTSSIEDAALSTELVIAHLTDLHIEEGIEWVLQEARSAALAIQDACSDPSCTIIVLFGGDLANKGTKSQIRSGLKYVDQLREELERIHRGKIISMMVPGNHDCDHGNPNPNRIGHLEDLGSSRPHADAEALLLEPLENYFSEVALERGIRSVTKGSPYASFTEITSGNHRIGFCLLNSAWCSSREEKANSLGFPMSELPKDAFLYDSQGDCASLTVGLIHHPLNWFRQPEVYRNLRSWIYEKCDILLVGHEHVGESFEITTSDQKKVHLVEGRALFDRNENEKSKASSFTIVRVDLDTRNLVESSAEWEPSRGIYVREEVTNAALDERFARSRWRFNPEFRAYLADAGMHVVHPNFSRPLDFEEIYMVPDFGGEDASKTRLSRRIAGDELLTELEGHEHTFISGDEKSGKTSLVKHLAIALRAAGKVPLIVQGEQLQSNRISQIKKACDSSLKKMYKGLGIVDFRNLSSSRQYIIVDDVNRLGGKSLSRSAILAELESLGSNIILVGNPSIFVDEALASGESAGAIALYHSLEILPFGEFQQERYSQHWLSLGISEEHEDEKLKGEAKRIASVLDKLLNMRLLPSYPVYILILLQQSDLRNHSVQDGDYGRLIENLMTKRLSEAKVGALTVEDRYAYLGELAFKLWQDRSGQMTPSEFDNWNKSYWNERSFSISSRDLCEELHNLAIFERSAEHVGFRYGFDYCFLLAMHIRDNMDQDAYSDVVRTLASQLYHRETADTVLFLSLMSRNSFVRDVLSAEAAGMFSEVDSAALEADVDSIEKLQSGRLLLQLDLGDPEQNRLEEKRKRDQDLSEFEEYKELPRISVRADPPESFDGVLAHINQQRAAIKMISVLGQAICNSRGTLKTSEKEELTDGLIGLMERCTASFLTLITSDIVGFAQEVAHHLQRHDKDLMHAEIVAKSGNFIYGMSQFFCFGSSRVLVVSLSSHLDDGIVQSTLATRGTPLSHVLNAMFELEKPAAFDRVIVQDALSSLQGNRFATDLLRIVIREYLYLNDADAKERQAACDALKIERVPGMLDQRRKA